MNATEDGILLAASGLVPKDGDRHRPLTPLDLTVRRGTITCLVGPDGTGKSRYLRALAGLDAPRSGQLTLLGRNAYTLNEEEWRKLRPRIGFLGSNTPLISFFSGWRNLLFAAQYHRLGSPETLEEKARELVTAIGADGDLEQLPAYLRGLQARKLTIVRALMLDPLVLLLDEPFRRYDRCLVRELEHFLLTRVRGTGLALVLVSHELGLAARHADQLLFCGDDGIHPFPSSAALEASPLPAVRSFLQGTDEGDQCDE